MLKVWSHNGIILIRELVHFERYQLQLVSSITCSKSHGSLTFSFFYCLQGCISHVSNNIKESQDPEENKKCSQVKSSFFFFTLQNNNPNLRSASHQDHYILFGFLQGDGRNEKFIYMKYSFCNKLFKFVIIIPLLKFCLKQLQLLHDIVFQAIIQCYFIMTITQIIKYILKIKITIHKYIQYV